MHRCTACGAGSHGWAGRCPACAAWNTLVEDHERGDTAAATGPRRRWQWEEGAPEPPVVLGEVDAADAGAVPTGIAELDRVLGGGLVPGSVTLLGGEPGIGKSTLLLQATAELTAGGARCLLVCGEESPQQVGRRAARIGAATASVWVVADTCLNGVVAAVDRVRPDVLVVDSVQTLYDADVGSAPGSLAQVRGCVQALVGLSKARRLTTVLVGHVTKDGALAGPRVLEHVVDTVLTFEGERHHALRLLRASKHRFGRSGELGLFEMTDRGLFGVSDPGHLFLGDRKVGGAGSSVFPAIEGHRPLVVELQALVAPSSLPMPRRSAQGLDAGRVALLIAVLQRRAGLSLGGSDVYVSAVGGVRVAEPGADLALCLALASAAADRPLPPDLVACGEVGLAGEVRQVAQTPRRLAEAARLGFRHALVPVGAEASDGALATTTVRSLSEVVSWAGLAARHPSRRGLGSRPIQPAPRPATRGQDRPASRRRPAGTPSGVVLRPVPT
jgi:DNA repair protein RadA/Sms